MNIDKLLNDVIKGEKKAVGAEDQQEKTAENGENNASQVRTFRELLESDLLDEDTRQQIYDTFKTDIELYIDDYLSRSKDPNADKGMYKCSLETWQACISEIGMYYFNKNKYLRDTKRIRQDGGQYFKSGLLEIGLTIYEDFCNEYRKQFFIYDCCKFLGMNMDTMYDLNTLHSDMLKRAHTKQESSMRTALASGRSNVTAMAILLNHDYDYTRTTQVIHTSGKGEIAADKLPELTNQTQHIDSIEDKQKSDLMVNDL